MPSDSPGNKPPKPIKLFTGEPIDGDYPNDLNRKGYVEILAGVAIGTDGPFTIGIYGES